MPEPWEGIFTALVTPMTVGEELDEPRLGEMVEYLIGKAGVHGIIPLGSTGEYYALSPEERQRVVALTVEAAAGRVPVVVGTNAGSTRDAVAFSRQAEQQGADGVMLAAPYYSLPTADELFEHFRAVDEAIDIPIMIYNYPGRTGVDMEPDLIGRLGELEHVGYVKESSGEISRMSEITRRFGERSSEAREGAVTVFCGCDTGALEAFVLGLKGWVGGVVNVIPKQHVQLHELAVVRGDFRAARDLYYQILPLLALMEQGGKYTQFVKAGCEMMGQPVGPPRRPLLPPSEGELSALRQLLEPFLP